MPDLSPPGRSLIEGTGLPGLIWSYRFDAEGRAEALDGAAALEAVARRETWVWLHFDLADVRTAARIAGLPGMPNDAIALLTGPDEHLRMIVAGEMLAGVMPDFAHGAGPDLRNIVAWRFAMAPHLFVTARRRQTLVLGGLHAALREGRRHAGVLRLFDALVDDLVDTLAALGRELADQLDAIEDALLDRGETEFEQLGRCRRQAARMRRLMPPLRSVLHGLMERPPAWVPADTLAECAALVRRAEHLAGDIMAVQERAHALQDEIASRQAEQTNERLALLSVITALLMPPTLISGIFGMNVAGLPFLEHGSGFIAAMGLMAVAFVGMLLLLRRLRVI